MKYQLLTASALCLLGSQVFGGGFQLSEYSATNLGRSFAGAGVVGDDYSAIAFNPAGMTLKKTGAQMGGNMVFVRADAKGSYAGRTSPNGHVRVNAFVPHFFAQKALNEKLRLGIGSYAPFGLSTKYDNNWFGSATAITSKITVVDVTPTVSYQLTDTFSLGAGLILERTQARMTNTVGSSSKISFMNAHDTVEFGYNLGVMWEPVKETRFGLAYRSKISHYIKGKHGIPELGLKGDVSTTLNFPEHILFSAYHRATEKIGLSAIAKWTRWSRFDELAIESGITPVPAVDEKWRNTWMVGTGLDYYYDKNWTFRGGVAFDQAGIRTASHRTARVPDNNRLMTSLGLTYKFKNWQIDGAYSHMFIHSADATYGGLNARYREQINILALQAQYNF